MKAIKRRFGSVRTAVIVLLALFVALGLVGALVSITPVLAKAEPDQDAFYRRGIGPVNLRAMSLDGADGLDAGWSNFHYYNVAGPVFRPRVGDVGWGYIGNCLFRDGVANDWFNLSVDIPDLSRIDYVRYYYYDTSANPSYANLTWYDGGGEAGDLVSVGSVGNTGYGSSLSNYLGEVVDTAKYSYLLNWNSNQEGTSMRLCGVRIAYRVPGPVAFLPVLFKN